MIPLLTCLFCWNLSFSVEERVTWSINLIVVVIRQCQLEGKHLATIFLQESQHPMSLACHRLISTSQKWLRQFFWVHNKQRHKGEVHNLLKFTETHDLKLMVSASSFPNHSSIQLRPYLHIHVERCLLTYMHGVFIKALNTYMDNAKKKHICNE